MTIVLLNGFLSLKYLAEWHSPAFSFFKVLRLVNDGKLNT